MSAKNQKSWTFLPFYFDDWLGSETVRLMSYAGRGLYIDALALQWRNGSIPADIENLARLLSSKEEQTLLAWPEIAPLFQPMDGQPGRLINERLEIIREEQLELQSYKKAHAQKAAGARWNRNANAMQVQSTSNADALQVQSSCNAIKSKDKSKSKVLLGKEPKHTGAAESPLWLEFLEIYPKRSGSLAAPKAKAKFLALVQKPEIATKIMEGVRRYRAWADHEGKTGSEHVSQIPTFINQERYNEPWAVTPPSSFSAIARRPSAPAESAAEMKARVDREMAEILNQGSGVVRA